MKRALSYIPLVLIILLMSMPALQMRFRIFREKPLNGAFILADEPDFSKVKWESGEYQAAAENYLKDHAGFKNFLVRLYNQMDYSLYRRANAEGATIGKNRQLFEYDYIRAWLAIDDPGDSFITKKLNRTKYIQEYLKREKGIDLVIVFEPGKASYYPEFINEKYTDLKSGPSTYEHYIEKARELGVDHIDWQAWFLHMKPAASFPLFPKYGTHWSIYGSYLAADSMLNFIEQRRGIKMGDIRVERMETSSIPRDTDDDVAKTMNLLFQPGGEELAYPVFTFDTAEYITKPKVLVVADSYYWNIYNTRIPRYLFANEAYWYFNTHVYPDYYFNQKRTDELDLKEEIEKQDVIFLMITERFVHKFDWTFIDKLYKLCTPDYLTDPIYDNINRIMTHAPWYSEVIEKGRKNNIALEEALILDARYIYHMNDTSAFLIRFGPEYYKRIIRGDAGWMASIREKARAEGISEDEMLQKEAMYSFEKNHPVYFDLNRGIRGCKEEMENSPLLYETLLRESSTYRFDVSELLWIKASERYRQEEIGRISKAILADVNWLNDVRIKAAKRNIPLEEMIRLDAAYVFDLKLR